VTTLTGTGVAPVLGASGSASAGYVLVGQSANASVTITNTGDGNKSGLGTISNLRGSIGSVATSTFAGSASSISLGDTASSTYSYVYTPTTRGASSTSVVSTFSNGGTSNVATSATASLIGTGVAPVNAVASSSATFVRIGTTATATVSISNVGDGNLSGAGTISNLRGSVGTSLGSGFTASISNPISVSLADSVSTTLGFTYTPVSHGSASSTVTFSLANGNTSGSNAAQTVTASVSATGVGPQYQSTFGTVNTPTAGASGAVSGATPPTISFGSVGINTKYTTYLNISNITTDANGGNAALTNLTLNSYTLSGVDASKFSVSLTPGTVVSKGGSVLIPIAVQGTSLGALSSTLTIFTDQGVALGGTGDTFTYNLTAVIPEPASMAVLGAGLAGLAFMRRRRKA
jgi:hypothetical protein